MDKKAEREYYEYLEKVIREQKAQTPFFKSTSQSYEIDIQMILEHIMRKNPNLAEQFFSNVVDTTQMKDASKADILRFVGRTEKGTIVKWKDESGEEIYLVNNGKHPFSDKKRVMVLGRHLNKSDLNELKKTVYGTMLKKDLRHVYKKIQQEQMRRQKKKESLFEYFERKNEQKVEHTASNFEKNFKRMVKEQGSSCIPFATAATMVSLMSGMERKNLSESLSHMGVRDSSDFEALLSKWKNEALNPGYELDRKRKRTRSVTVEYTR